MPPPAPQLAETSKQAVNVSLHLQLEASDRPSLLLLTLNCFGLWIPDGCKKSHGNVSYFTVIGAARMVADVSIGGRPCDRSREEADLAGIVSKSPMVVKV